MIRVIGFLFLFLYTFLLNAQCIKGTCKEGYGVMQYMTGDKYKGNFHKGYREGKGIMYYENGDKYLGKWKKDKRNGKGKMIQSSGNSYIANFSNDIELSKVIVNNDNPDLASPNPTTENTTYQIIKDCNTHYCHNELGMFYYSNNAKYTGSFLNGLPEGQGIIEYPNGDRYEGGWKDNAMQGEGIAISHNGTKMRAMWENGIPIKKLAFNQNISLGRPITKPEFSKEVKIWAVIVGIASYNHMPSLRYTDDDAYKMFAFLKSPEGGALPDDQITVLIDDMATRDEIMTSMNNLFLKADENDVIMLYFSGHGLKGSFIPYDYNGYENELFHTDIQKIFAKSEAKQKVCFADACYSGSYAAKTTLEESIAKLYQVYGSTNGGTALLMSSSENETSLEYKGLRQGVYSHFLMRGLKGEADVNHNNIITIVELYDFIKKGVVDYTANLQSPILIGDFDIAMPVAMMRQ